MILLWLFCLRRVLWGIVAGGEHTSASLGVTEMAGGVTTRDVFQPETMGSLTLWTPCSPLVSQGCSGWRGQGEGIASTEAGRDDWEQEHCRAAYTAAGGTGQTSRLATLQPLNSTFSPFTSNPNSLLTNKKQLPHSSCVQTFPHSLQWRPRLQNKNAQKIFFGDSRCFLNNALIQSFQNGSGGRSAECCLTVRFPQWPRPT